MDPWDSLGPVGKPCCEQISVTSFKITLTSFRSLKKPSNISNMTAINFQEEKHNRILAFKIFTYIYMKRIKGDGSECDF